MSNSYWPEDTDTKFYIENQGCGAVTLLDIIEKVKQKWGSETGLDKITIEGEHIHTSCIGYDLYDGADWTDFIVVEYDPNR